MLSLRRVLAKVQPLTYKPVAILVTHRRNMGSIVPSEEEIIRGVQEEVEKLKMWKPGQPPLPGWYEIKSPKDLEDMSEPDPEFEKKWGLDTIKFDDDTDKKM